MWFSSPIPILSIIFKTSGRSRDKVRLVGETSLCNYARPAQPGPNRTRLCGPCIATIAGD